MKKQISKSILILFGLLSCFSIRLFAKVDSSKVSSKLIFELSSPTIRNGFVDVDVTFSSLNNINALDFSLQFNQPKLAFDSVIDHTNYLQELFYYSASTKTLRFTSNSFQSYGRTAPLFSIRFKSDSAKISTKDLFAIKGYLNGDVCNSLVIDSLTLALGPKNVRPPNNFKSLIACGDAHTLALQVDGQAWAWGSNANGQLGDNSSTSRNFPVKIKGVSNTGLLNNVTAIAAGSGHSLAILCDGSIVAWGSNTNGQLGNNTNAQSLFPVVVQGLPAGTRAYSIAAGANHSIAVMEDGSVWAWGKNSFGQLGNNTITDALIPVQVHGPANKDFLIKAMEVAAGSNHSLVLMKDGSVRAFGNAANGQTGNGNASGVEKTPITVLDNNLNTSLSNVIGISAGGDHSMALLADGRVKGWGDNASGQLGDGSNNTKALAVFVNGIVDAKAIAAGAAFGTAILKDGSAWSWGNNGTGQLGNNGLGINTTTPVQMHGVENNGSLTGVLTVGAGKDFCTGIFDDALHGSIWTCGNNALGQLGDSTNVTRSTPVKVTSGLSAGLLKASFNPATGTAICFPSGKVTFMNTGSTGGLKTYAWNFGNGADPAISTMSNPDIVTYPSPGLKNILFAISEGQACNTIWTDSARQTINIVAGANANFTTSGISCVGQGINLYNAGSTGSGVLQIWDFGTQGDPVNSAEENPKGLVYKQPGAYTITHRVFVPTCSVNDTKMVVVTVNPAPTVSFSSSGSLCPNKPVVFLNSGTQQPGLLYFWEFGAGALEETSASQTPNEIFYKTPGVKNVTLNVKNLFGCHSSLSQPITIKQPPVASFATSASSQKCSGSRIDFKNTGSSKSVLFNWDFNEASNLVASQIENPEGVIYTKPGTKSIILTVMDTITHCSTQVTNAISINPVPASSISSLQDTINPGGAIQLEASAGASYSWSPSGSLSNEAIRNPFVSPKVTTSYSVKVSDANGCQSTAFKTIVVKNDSYWIPSGFTPDGSGKNDVLYVRGDGIKDFEMEIFSGIGEPLFYSKSIHHGWDGKKQSSGEDVPEGAYVYFIKGTKSDGTIINDKGLINLIR